ncbi:MAG: acyl-CoA dehydrogenase family protein [Bacteroidetes bacterium]|nr:acyl-CoA dehydrogenase family protein [Bacteroidota bacterium]
MSTFPGLDYLKLDDWFSEDEKLIRDTIRQFVDQSVLPIIEDAYLEGKFPHQLVSELGSLGAFGANLPETYECAGLSNIAYGLICQELERGDSGVRSFVSVQGSLVMYPIFTYGSEEQKRFWLPKLARGEKIGCFGLTEPDFGSNPGGLITRSRRDGNSIVLNGAKMWITNGTIADVAVVWAKDEAGEIKGYLVEKGTPGYTAPEIKKKHSLRASVTSELVFADCRIPLENELPKAKGLKAPLSCLNQARYGIAWGAIGSAMASYQSALDYTKSRIQFNKPIASFQLVQNKLVYMLNEITKAQLLAYRVGQLKDKGEVRPQHISMAKRNNVDMALECARLARDMMGANGITAEYPVMRHMNNLESVKTYEGTHDIHTLILGHDITGIPAYE